MEAPLILRPRQNALLERLMVDIQKHDSIILIAPTGSGKTVMLSAFMARLVEENPDIKILCLVHRKEIFDQNLKTAERLGLKCQIYWNTERELKPECNVIFSMQITCFKALDKNPKVFGKVDYIIVDEAHHINSFSYKFILNYLKAENDKLKSVGWTATPLRTDKEFISDIFPHLSDQIFLKELINDGALAPFNIIIPDHQKLKSYLEENGEEEIRSNQFSNQFSNHFSKQSSKQDDLVLSPEMLLKWWQDFTFLGIDELGTHYRPTVAFMPSINTCIEMKHYFLQRGIKASLVTGLMPMDLRKQILEDYACGKIQILFNFNILTEGWNEPYTSCIIIARKRSHSTTVIQMLGRGLRVLTGNELRHSNPHATSKKDCIILDYFGCTEGLPGLEQFLTFKRKEASKEEKVSITIKNTKKIQELDRVKTMTYGEKLAYFFHKSKVYFDDLDLEGTPYRVIYSSVSGSTALVIYFKNACPKTGLESILMLCDDSRPFTIVHQGSFEVSLDIANSFILTTVDSKFLKGQSVWGKQRSEAKSAEKLKTLVIDFPVKNFIYAWITSIQKIKTGINKNSILFYIAMVQSRLKLDLNDIFKALKRKYPPV